jgi:hypothetical protein
VPGCQLTIAGELDEVLVWIADVDGGHCPSCARLFDWTNFDLDTLRRKIPDDFLDPSIAHKAHVTCSGGGDICVRQVLCAERVQIDLLASKVKSVELALKHDMSHSQDSLVELDSPGHVAHSENQVVDACDFHGLDSFARLSSAAVP